MRTSPALALSLSLSVCAAPALVAAQTRAGVRPPPGPAFTFTPAAPAPSAPRVALVVRVVGATVTVSRLSPTDRTVTALPFTVEAGSDVNRGSGSTLSLSPDGARLALVRARLPYVRDLASGSEVRIFGGRAADVELTFTGWSPDGSRLAYRVSARETMEGPAARLPVRAGSYVWAGPGTQPVLLTRAPDEPQYWAADGAALLAHAFVAQDRYELRRVPIDNAPITVLSAVALPYGYAQLHPVGDTMLSVRSELGPRPGTTSASYVAQQSLDGANLRRLSPDAPFATDQRPAYAPDRARYAYLHGPAYGPFELMVGEVATAAPVAAHRCRTRCWFAWEAPDRLLVVDDRRLLRVPVSGPPVELVGSNVRAVVVAGDG